ncbi:MAG: recombinase family protein [Janthinobacterium lividum]
MRISMAKGQLDAGSSPSITETLLVRPQPGSGGSDARKSADPGDHDGLPDNSFPKAASQSTRTVETARLRAVAYCRVSTKRQAENELSLVEQQAEIERFCARKGWVLVAEYVERGASGTSGRRPVLQKMLGDARSRPRPFEIVVVFNLSRFFRNLVESETTRATLAKSGIQVHSAQQDFGIGKEAKFFRQLVSATDEFSSDTNAEQVKTMMIANSAAGWWNGSKPPFGYRTEIALRLGKKDKKVLQVDPAEAHVVRRIFALYLSGESGSSPMGLKAICTTLNAEHVGLRNKPFLTSTISDILKRRTYVGTYFYNTKDSRTNLARDPSEWIAVPVPSLVSQADFDAVQARLATNHPRVTAPRTVNSPTLLAGLGTCGHEGCGSGLLLMTGKGGQHRYYTCQKKRTQSATACGSKARPMAEVDAAVIDAVERLILAPDRIELLLAGLLEESNEALARRRADLGRLRAEKTRADAALTAIWQVIEAGAASALDADVAERMVRARGNIKRLGDEIRLIEDQSSMPSRRITPEIVARFADRVRSALRGSDPALRQGYVRLLISEVVLAGSELQIRGSKKALEAAVAARRNGDAEVLTFAQSWCARNDSNVRPSDS